MKHFFTFLFMMAFSIVTNAQLVVNTGSMSIGRDDFATGLLNNGKVIACGGTDESQIGDQPTYNTTELYDPSTGTWSPTGSMHKTRCDFAGILLDNGNYMVVGGDLNGNDPFEGSESCEIYNPSTGTWSYTDSLSIPATFTILTRLFNGKILAFTNADGACELYDQKTGTWSVTGSTSVILSTWSTMCQLNDGRVLIVGSGSNNGEVYDTATGTWSVLSSTMQFQRDDPTSILMTNDKVLIAGGGFQTTSELFDPSTNQFEDTSDFVNGNNHVRCDMINLKNGNVLISGDGNIFDETNEESLEVYDTTNNTWFLAGEVPYSIVEGEDYGVFRLSTGKILFDGGVFGLTALSGCKLVDEDDIGTGITTPVINFYSNVYPNPSNGSFTIDLSNYKGQNMIMNLYDITGRLIFSGTSNNASIIRTSSITGFPKLTAGVYVLEFLTGKSTLQKKIIVQ